MQATTFAGDEVLAIAQADASLLYRRSELGRDRYAIPARPCRNGPPLAAGGGATLAAMNPLAQEGTVAAMNPLARRPWPRSDRRQACS